jgi:hypothetical protein
MATTAVVNPRRGKNGRFMKGSSRKRNPSRRHKRRRHRRHNYGAAATINPSRRHRRRTYGGGKRRRNPVSPYASTGYYREPNPSEFSMDEVTEVVPAATGGIWAARFALKQAGAFEPAKDGTLEPGFKHAIAIYLGAVFGGQMVGSILGDESKGRFARVAALGFGGDLFMRTRFMRDSDFVQKNLSLQGMGDDEEDYVAGFEQQSAIGEPTMVDAFGNRYVSTPAGWQLAGVGEQFVQDEQGNIYALSGGGGGGAKLAGFAPTSPLGAVRSSNESSFGYSR